MGAGREDAASFPGGKKQMSGRCASIKGWGAILMVLGAISAVERGSGADGEGSFAPLGWRGKFFGAGQGRREESKGLSVRLQSGGFLEVTGVFDRFPSLPFACRSALEGQGVGAKIPFTEPLFTECRKNRGPRAKKNSPKYFESLDEWPSESWFRAGEIRFQPQLNTIKLHK
jgi:hypothetical protein